MRYCGSPLKYSFSEAKDEKSISMVELNEKGNVSVRLLPLKPIHDMRELRGSYMELTLRENYIKEATGDYLHITLTDDEDIPEGMRRLQVIYPNLMKLDYDNRRTRAEGIGGEAAPDAESPLDLFCSLYEKQNGGPMSDEQKARLRDMIAEIWETEGTK